MAKIVGFNDYRTNQFRFHSDEKRKTAMSKKNTPEYVKEIREKKYDFTAGVSRIYKECNIDSYPINVVQIAKQLGFDIFYRRIKQPNVYGAMWDGFDEISVGNEKSNRFILVNADDSVEKKIFTIAHELGHFFLHCNDKQNFYERYHKDNDNPEMKMAEDQADYFAANLLLPSFIFVPYIYKNKELSRKDLVNKICDNFLVEKETVEKRFKELSIDV